MDVDAFKDSPSGSLIRTTNGQMAFVPNRLPPPEIDYARLAIPLADTMQAIGELNAAGRGLTDPMLVIRPLQRREALLSSAMEGTFTTANQLALAESEDDLVVDAATLEVRNYIRAFDVANSLRSEIPICNRMIKSVHKTLLAQTNSNRGSTKRLGEFKDQQNFISGGDRRIERARFVPPPPMETEAAMADLERYINREIANDIPPIIESALIHYQFETIHPFADGNGRVGRILIPIHLMQTGLFERPLLYISPAVEGRKKEYVDGMLAVSQKGEWSRWIEFYLSVVKASCQSAIETLDRMETLRREYRDRISESGGSARYIRIADDLFLSPVTTIPRVAERLAVSYPSAKNAVEKLSALGILNEVPGMANPKRYICWRIVDISEGRSELEPEGPVSNI